MTEIKWAEFVGFQKDERIDGVRPFFVLHAEGSDRDGSTVFTETVKKLDIPIPPIPQYEPENFEDKWTTMCENCHITWMNTEPVIKHIRNNINHRIVSYKVPIAENLPFDQKDPQVWVRDDEKKTGRTSASVLA